MLFNSHSFLFILLPVALSGFCLLGARGSARLAMGWLVAVSLFFYGWWNPPYLALILGSVLGNYALSRRLSPRAGRPRRALLACGVGANLALLAYYKYAGFLVDNWNGLFGSSFGIGPILLPLAISFFTFQQIAYLVDAHRGEVEEHSLLDYALFVTFFPQLIAGPIVYHGEMLPQFRQRDFGRLVGEHLAVGTTIFGIGLFKKVVIADSLALFATPVFAHADAGGALDTTQAWTGALAYTFQLYFDFSGYSDMAIGLARMFGLRLALNFDSPYKATSLIDFWRRWHMTLSRFLRTYLYIPLGGNRAGRVRRYANLLLTMLLGGLWHGAGWNFVAWGALHGIGLVANHGLRRFGSPRAVGLHPAFGCALTFLFVVCGWVLFRAETLPGAWTMLLAMAGSHGEPSAGLVPAGAASALAATGLLVWLAPNTQQLMHDYQPALETYAGEVRAWPRRFPQWRPTPGWALAMAALLLLAVDGLRRPSEFLYFQF